MEQHLQLRPEDDRRTDIIHVSEMAKPDWCPRASYYSLSGLQADTTQTHFRARGVFDEGDRIHEKWQSRLWRMGILRGKFRCILCDHRWWATSPEFCPGCGWMGTDHLRYLEVPMMDSEFLIGGSADADLDDGHSKSALAEMKSIGIGTVRNEAPHLLRQHTHKTAEGKSVIDVEGLWRAIKSPFPSHMRQGWLYLWLANYDVMVFLYESKMNQAHKELIVKRDDSKIDHLLDQAEDVVEALDEGEPPPHPKWAEPDNRTCLSCGFRATCWGIDARDGERDEQETKTGVGRRSQGRSGSPEVPGDAGPGQAGARTRASSRGRREVSTGTSRRSLRFIR